MSGKMAAIVGYMLGQEFTTPAIEDICRTSDDCCLAQQEGDIGYNVFLGAYSDLKRNWHELVTMPEVGLTAEEEAHCLNLLSTKIRQVNAGIAEELSEI
jgi:hypothetical protein